jgi:hypothetical protein
MSTPPLWRANLSNTIKNALDAQPITDMHTHLYPPFLRHPPPRQFRQSRPHRTLPLGNRRARHLPLSRRRSLPPRPRHQAPLRAILENDQTPAGRSRCR